MQQCVLKRRSDEGVLVTVSWLPESYAEKDKVVKLKNQDGHWVDGWKVTSVSSYRRDANECILRSQDYRKQRRFSDV